MQIIVAFAGSAILWMNVKGLDNKYAMGLTTSGTHHQVQVHSEPILRMFAPIDQRQTMSSDASSPINKNDSSGYVSEGTPSPNSNKDNEILDNMDWNLVSLNMFILLSIKFIFNLNI